MTGVLITRGEGTETQGGEESDVKTEAEMGVLQPRAKEPVWPPEAGRDRRSLPGASGGSAAPDAVSSGSGLLRGESEYCFAAKPVAVICAAATGRGGSRGRGVSSE